MELVGTSGSHFLGLGEAIFGARELNKGGRAPDLPKWRPKIFQVRDFGVDRRRNGVQNPPQVEPKSIKNGCRNGVENLFRFLDRFGVDFISFRSQNLVDFVKKSWYKGT